MHLGKLIKSIAVIRVALAHDRIGDDRIDLNSVNVLTAVRHGAQDVDATTGSDNCVFSVRSEHVGKCGRRRHQISFPGSTPGVGVDVYQRAVGVRVEYDPFRVIRLLVHLDPRESVDEPSGSYFAEGTVTLPSATARDGKLRAQLWDTSRRLAKL